MNKQKDDKNLHTLYNIVNKFNNDIYKDIIIKSRKRELVILRNIYCMLASDLGFTAVDIGKYLDRDHTTILHSINSGYDLLETDKEFQQLYILISTTFNPEKYPHARINKTIIKEQTDTRSISSIGMYSRKYIVNRPNSKQKSGLRYTKRFGIYT